MFCLGIIKFPWNEDISTSCIEDYLGRKAMRAEWRIMNYTQIY